MTRGCTFRLSQSTIGKNDQISVGHKPGTTGSLELSQTNDSLTSKQTLFIFVLYVSLSNQPLKMIDGCSQARYDPCSIGITRFKCTMRLLQSLQNQALGVRESQPSPINGSTHL
eukprot:m.130147 g.130147  ORF g.130147 m.130147 type:complete len:114 (+) comp15870_c1_seq7:622-963(+)